jgi:outer membrane lipoprotein LolB
VIATTPPAGCPAVGAWLVVWALCVTGCAATGGRGLATAPGEGPLVGRLSVQVAGHPDRGLAADFELSGSALRGELVLTGPLGATAARARWAPGEAVLSTPQGDTREPDLDTLAERALGEAVPMAALFDWLRGRPWPDAPSQPLDGDEPGFQQLGWQVRLDRLAEGRVEARRLAAPEVTVRVRLLPS